MFFYFLLNILFAFFISSLVGSEQIVYFCPEENVTFNYCFKLWNILLANFSSTNCDGLLTVYPHFNENQQLLIVHSGENEQLITVVSAIFSCDFLYSVTIAETKDLKLISNTDEITLIIIYSKKTDKCTTYWIDKQENTLTSIKICNNTQWFISESESTNSNESYSKISISNNKQTDFDQNIIKNKTLRVALSPNYLPFVNCFIDSNNQSMCQGVVIEILDMIRVRLNCTIQYVFPVDDYYGTEINGTWKGLVGQVYRQEVDFAAAALSITYERNAAVHFSSPFYFETIGILIQQKAEPSTLFKFVFVFPFTIWVAVIVVVIGSILITYAFGKLAIDQRSVSRCSRYQDCIMCIYKVLVVQTGPISVTNWPSRIFQLGSRMCIFLMIATYTGSLIATLTSKRAYVPFNNLIGLADEIAKGQYKICMSDDSAFYANVMESDLPEYKIIKKFFQSNPSYVTDDDACAEKIFLEDNVALVNEVLFLESVQGKFCRQHPTYLLSDRLFPAYFGFAVPKNSSLNPIISLIITETVEKGLINFWKQKYADPESDYCESSTPNGIYQAEIKPLSLVDIGVAFVILVVGTATCVAVLVVEYKRFQVQNLSHYIRFGIHVTQLKWKKMKIPE